jgi:hypothetical protein
VRCKLDKPHSWLRFVGAFVNVATSKAKRLFLRTGLPVKLYERFDALAAELASLKVDVLVASSTPAALAAKRTTRTYQFEPELVWTMRSVLDSAVDQIDAANRTPATKAKMAERILRVVSDGIADPLKLTPIAIEDGMQPAD